MYLLCVGYSSSLSESSLSDTWWSRRLLDFPRGRWSRGRWWMWCTVGDSVTTPGGTTGTPGTTPVVITGVPVVAPGYVLVWWWTGDETTLKKKEEIMIWAVFKKRGSFVNSYYFVIIYVHKLHFGCHSLVVVGWVGCRRGCRSSRMLDIGVC